MSDKRNAPWSAERKAAHGAKIRAALAARGRKKKTVSRAVRVSRVSVRSTSAIAPTLADLVADYDRAKQAIRDHLDQ